MAGSISLENWICFLPNKNYWGKIFQLISYLTHSPTRICSQFFLNFNLETSNEKQGDECCPFFSFFFFNVRVFAEVISLFVFSLRLLTMRCSCVQNVFKGISGCAGFLLAGWLAIIQKVAFSFL